MARTRADVAHQFASGLPCIFPRTPATAEPNPARIGQKRNRDGQQAPVSASQDIDRRRCDNQEKDRCKGGKKDVAENPVVHL